MVVYKHFFFPSSQLLVKFGNLPPMQNSEPSSLLLPTSHTNPKISIIIPTYNSAAFLPQALESVFAQNYTSYEIIVVDDGSTDETQAALQPYFNRIHYIVQDNAGSAAARNTGLWQARGELIVLLDADDLLLPGKLREQAAFLQIRPNLGAVHSGWRLLNEQGNPIRDIEPWHEAPVLDLETWLRRKPVKMGAMMFRRAWLESVGGLDPDLRQSHDVDLMLRLSLAGCQMAWMYKPTLCYRHYANSTIRRNAPKQAIYVNKVLDKFFAAPHVPAEIRQRERQTRYYSAMWLAWHLYRSGFGDESIPYLKETLALSDSSNERVVVDWHRHFLRWLAGDGLDVAEINQIRPFFAQAAALSSDQWGRIDRFVAWWLQNSADSKTDLETAWQLFQASLAAEQPNLPAEAFSNWWLDVWLPFLHGGTPAFSDFAPFSAAQLVKLCQFAIVRDPGNLTTAQLNHFWQTAESHKLIPPDHHHQVAALLLTFFGQSVLGRRWGEAAKALGQVVGMSHHPHTWQAWVSFLESTWAYFTAR